MRRFIIQFGGIDGTKQQPTHQPTNQPTNQPTKPTNQPTNHGILSHTSFLLNPDDCLPRINEFVLQLPFPFRNWQWGRPRGKFLKKQNNISWISRHDDQPDCKHYGCYSKNFPTDPWSIPQTPNQQFMKEFLSFGGLGMSGVCSRGMLGLP